MSSGLLRGVNLDYMYTRHEGLRCGSVIGWGGEILLSTVVDGADPYRPWRYIKETHQTIEINFS